MTPKRILITGASGCIGQYLTEALAQETEHELYLLVRNPKKLGFVTQDRPSTRILQADLREIECWGGLIKTINVVILVATAWGGRTETFEINVTKTLRLIELLDPNVCEQVIYFSTASILNRNNQLLQEAGQLGTDYIRSKYECLQQLSKLAIAPKLTTLFPTLVLGGDENKPYSHLSSGIADVVKWVNLIRWFKADGSFHFIHARDIAQIVLYLVNHPHTQDLSLESSSKLDKRLVLGNEPVSVNQVVEEVCAYLGKKVYFRLPLYIWLANLFIVLFRIQMSAWDRFSLNYRHFTYQNTINSRTFGLDSNCTTITDVLEISGIQRKLKLEKYTK
ncbi:MAG: NAD(P)-dependent oxidoreductase [Symploca sp. SIO2E9]|nr:NAD(P)-dependent oxidoreductase [Symploca sp. SIO2E9]